ncbi:MAG: MGMT family protein [Gammaproteobacteria bacterium]
MSYHEFAAQIGAPRAARAVAGAIAANHIAVLVPCHRVVRAGGEPGDYRWGRSLKLALLAAEQVASNANCEP